MSTTTINFKTTLLIGEEEIPLITEAVIGDQASQDGVENGFLFKLNRDSSDPPVTVYLGDVIQFIETKLGGDNLSQNEGMALISQAFPSLNPDNFNSENQTLINIYEFTINSTTSEFLFSLNLDIEGSDPSTGLIELPGALASWLKIENLSIAFSADKKKSETL